MGTASTTVSTTAFPSPPPLSLPKHPPPPQSTWDQIQTRAPKSCCYVVNDKTNPDGHSQYVVYIHLSRRDGGSVRVDVVSLRNRALSRRLGHAGCISCWYKK